VCSKRGYTSQSQAAGALRALRRGPLKKDRMAVYHCQRCRAWHLGHAW
jgi:hypothetical protein